jgi:hypothetical protein
MMEKFMALCTSTIDEPRASLKHWKLIKLIRQNVVNPREFKEKWGVSNAGLARLLDLSPTHVQRWFFAQSATNYREPEEKYLRRLAEVDFIWTVLETLQESLDKCPEHIKEVYKELRRNR